MTLEYGRETLNFIHQLHQSFEPEVNIYNQAVLRRVAPLNRKAQLFQKEKDTIVILFRLSGEIEGQIVCSLKVKSEKNIDSIRSLFTESMNILLGKFLTQLEDETGFMSIISIPEVLEDNEKIKKLSESFSKYNLICSTEYELHSLSDTYPCHIQMIANKKSIKEV